MAKRKTGITKPKVIVDPWGVTSGYQDNFGGFRETPSETRLALHAAMGAGPDSLPEQATKDVRVLRDGSTLPAPWPAELKLEDGTTIPVDGSVPDDLPYGYHDLRSLEDGRTIRLIRSPEHCWLRDKMRIWGWVAQLYAVRSARSWGFGDLADLRDLAKWSVELGAQAVLINPLNAVPPVTPQQASPYYPATRRFRNPLYLAVEEIPGAQGAGIDLERQAAAGRALNEWREIDRDSVFRLKMEAFELLWRRLEPPPAFEAYCLQQGESLRAFATYCALAETHGGDWRQWPSEFRRYDSAAVRRFADQRSDRIRFHCWLQWLLDEQLSQAIQTIDLVQDLPIGVAPGGADAWQWQDVIAADATIGAPPDVFNSDGQDWGLPPFIPHRLKETLCQPFIETIRAAMRHASGLRIDHVMGLFRLYWIPRGFTPDAGAYVRYPSEELLAIVAVESHRAGAWVAGEDLGTVEKSVRKRLKQLRILTYRLLWFEDHPPAEYPEHALAAITTHDLPTVAGLWTGADYAAQAKIGLKPHAESYREMWQRLVKPSGLTADADTETAVEKAYETLAAAPSAVLAVNLDDAAVVKERTNMPGTVDRWPNWSLALPVSLEELKAAKLPSRIAELVSRRRACRESQAADAEEKEENRPDSSTNARA